MKRRRPSKARPFLPSPHYFSVRGYQLEGRYPRDLGAWPITPLRIAVGWGMVPYDYWPKRPDEEWPPEEPPRVDEIAKRCRAGYYQRVRSSEDARRSIGFGRIPVGVGLRVTRQWLCGGTDGTIDLPGPDAEFVGDHQVVLDGYGDGRFKFANSWGQRWGKDGRGTLPYEYVDRYMIEAHALVPFSPPRRRGSVAYWQGVSPVGAWTHGFYAIDAEADEREAWAFAFERDGYLDVEELFVRPIYRRKGRGSLLADELCKVAVERGIPLRAWISHADAERNALPGVLAMVRRLGLSLGPSPTNWARYVATAGLRATLINR